MVDGGDSKAIEFLQAQQENHFHLRNSPRIFALLCFLEGQKEPSLQTQFQALAYAKECHQKNATRVFNPAYTALFCLHITMADGLEHPNEADDLAIETVQKVC